VTRVLGDARQVPSKDSALISPVVPKDSSPAEKNARSVSLEAALTSN